MYEGEFVKIKDYKKRIQKKTAYLQNYPSKKAIWFVLVNAFGVKQNAYAGIFEKVVVLEDLMRSSALH